MDQRKNLKQNLPGMKFSGMRLHNYTSGGSRTNVSCSCSVQCTISTKTLSRGGRDGKHAVNDVAVCLCTGGTDSSVF